METNIVVDISPPIPYLAKFLFSSYGPKCCQNDEVYFWHINIKVFYKLILSFWVCVSRHTQNTQNTNFAYLCNISRKALGVKLIFCLHINTKVFYKLIVSLWVCVARYAQSTQNNKFTISL